MLTGGRRLRNEYAVDLPSLNPWPVALAVDRPVDGDSNERPERPRLLQASTSPDIMDNQLIGLGNTRALLIAGLFGRPGVSMKERDDGRVSMTARCLVRLGVRL